MQHLLEFLCLGVDLCLEGGVGLVEVESGSLLLLQLLLHLTLLALQQHHQRVSHNTTSVSVTTPPACQSQHHQRVSHNTTSVSVTTPPACQSQHHQRVSHNTTSVSVTTPPACQSQHHQRVSHNTTSVTVTTPPACQSHLKHLIWQTDRISGRAWWGFPRELFISGIFLFTILWLCEQHFDQTYSLHFTNRTCPGNGLYERHIHKCV